MTTPDQRLSSSRLSRARQPGAALVVGLLLLLVLTVLAISGMTMATLDLQMAGNHQFEERAFQAAEAGIERAISAGVFKTNAPTVQAAVAVAAGSEDTLEYTITFAEDHGVTPVPRGGYSLGTGFEAYHFEIASTGSSRRGAESVHEQGFYIVGPGGG
jgi:Tfp pilus assembly protein PilX